MAGKTSSSRILVSFVAVAFLTILMFQAGCEKERIRINLQDTSAVTSDSQEEFDRPIIRMAIAAMISPETTRDYYYDLLQVVADSLGNHPIFVQRQTYAEINEMVRNHEVDVAIVCSGPYSLGHDEGYMELLVVPISHGKITYNSYILVHRDSPYKAFEDLRGAMFAFTDPNSNTGFLVPNYMLAKIGETSGSFFRETFFTHSHDNSINAVAEKLADGAAVDGLIWEFMNSIDSTKTSRTRILEVSPPYGIPPIVVNPDMKKADKERIRDIFLALNNNPAAEPILRELQIDGFKVADDSIYNSVRDMRRWLEEQR